MWSIKDIENIYNKYQIKASKRFGQNFLIDQNILHKIVSSIDIKDNNIIEIGPGLGSLSLALLQSDPKNILAYEVDNNMINVLNHEINDERFKLIHQDFLKADLTKENSQIIVGNIPYNITSDIIFKILKNSNYIKNATLMMQREVGKRIMSNVGSKEYGKLAVTTRYFADVKEITNVKANSFYPSPKVDSIVLQFSFKKSFDKEFSDFIKISFQFRRKTLINNLKNQYSLDDINNFFNIKKMRPTIRPQELSILEYRELYEHLNHKKA